MRFVRAPWRRTALVVAGGAVTWLLTATAFDPLFIAGGSGPAMIWGPASSRSATVMIAVLVLVVAAIARRRWAVAAMVAWTTFLTFSTHRIVERSDGAAIDWWLGVAVRSLPADVEEEPSRPRCIVGRWRARCADEAGKGFVVLSALPMTALLPGAWEVRR